VARSRWNAPEENRAVAEHTPFIDFQNLPTPKDGFLVTHFIIVRSVARSRAFYSDVLGGQVVMEENPCMVKLANSWVIMNPGGPPTPDKPEITAIDYEPGDTVSTFMNLRVADIQACYEAWRSKGAEFLTPPIDRGAEIRCYMRDPDGYLIEVRSVDRIALGQPRREATRRPAGLTAPGIAASPRRSPTVARGHAGGRKAAARREPRHRPGLLAGGQPGQWLFSAAASR
jgi:catechol 2,3-dioxygenase-like lactoylglutathione lyase family enzyme